MNKQIVIRLLTTEQIDLNELADFVNEYTFNELNRRITSEELSGIIQAIRMGIFDIRYAAMKAAYDLKLNVMEIFNRNGYLVKTIVTE